MNVFNKGKTPFKPFRSMGSGNRGPPSRKVLIVDVMDMWL